MTKFSVPNLNELNQPRWKLFLLLMLSAFFLFPLFRTGYTSDDATDSLLPGVLKVEGFTLPEYIGAMAMNCTRCGRFFPLQMVYLHLWFYVVQTPVVHKAMVIAGVLIDLVLFALLVRRIGKNTEFAIFATCLVFPLFQFRIHFDPILSFFGLLQLITAGVLGSLLALQIHLDTDRRRWLVLSIALYLAVLLLYEFTYPLFLLHVVLIGYGRRVWKTRISSSLPFIVAGGLGFLSTILIRWLYLSEDQALIEHNSVNTDLLSFLVTLANQTSAAFPLSYYLANPAGLFPRIGDLVSVVGFVATAGGLLIFAATLAACLSSLWSLPTEDDARTRGRLIPMALLGLLLGLLPAILISISGRHQKMIKPGIGYTPVFLQYFGLGLLMATGVWSLLTAMAACGSPRRWARMTTALMVAVTAALTYRANSVLVDSLEKPMESPSFNPEVGSGWACWNRQRQNLESALRAGLVENVPEYAAVFLENEYPCWYDRAHCRYFFATYGSKVFNSTPLKSDRDPVAGWFLLKASKCFPDPPPGTTPYLVRDVCLDKRTGYVVLSRYGPFYGNGQPRARDADGSGEVRLFVQHPNLFGDGPTPLFTLLGQAPAFERGAAGQRIVHRGRELTMLRSGRDWGLFSFRPIVRNFDPNSLTLVFEEVSASWGDGFYETETGQHSSWRWSRPRGVLTLTNTTDAPRKIKISMLLHNMGNAPLILDGGPLHAEVRTGSNPVRFERELTLNPGEYPVEIYTDFPPASSPTDPRLLSFRVINFNLQDKERR